ncbi:hypothetical protein STEG23_015457 [Scotinomys teguina]
MKTMVHKLLIWKKLKNIVEVVERIPKTLEKESLEERIWKSIFETGFLCVALAVMELTLASESEICSQKSSCLCLLSSGIKGSSIV